MKKDENRRLLLLSIILMAISMTATLVAVVLLYKTALEGHRQDLIVTARSQARLIEAIAYHDRQYSDVIRTSIPEYDAFEASLHQVVSAHRTFAGFGKTGEFTLAQKEGNLIVFRFRHHVDRVVKPQPIPFDSKLAEPMRRALNGASGSMIGLDYKGDTVLAAYEPVADLNLGIVAKINLSEVRQPFVYASVIAFALTMVLVAGGVVLLRWIIAPLFANLQSTSKNLEQEIKQHRKALVALRESEARFVQIADAAEDVFWLVNCQNPEEPRVLYVNQAFEKIWQCPVKDVLHDHQLWFATIHPQDQSRIKAVYHQFLRGEGEFDDEFRLCLSGGEIRHIQIKGELIRDAEGRIVRAAGLAHDVTLIKAVEQRVQQANQKLESRVEKRTAELSRTIRLMTGRELRMAELKEEIARLKQKLQQAEGVS